MSSKFRLIFILSLFFSTVNAQSDQLIDSLKVELSKANDNSEKADILLELSTKLNHYTKWEEAVPYMHRFLTIAKNIQPDTLLAHGYSELGNIYVNLGKIDSAEFYLNLAYEMFERIENRFEIARIYKMKGYIKGNYQSDYVGAIDYHLKAVNVFEELGNEEHVIMSYNNISVIFENQGKVEESYTWTSKALKIIDSNPKYKESSIAFDSNQSMGMNLLRQERDREAIAYFDKAIKIAEKLESPFRLAVSNAGKGTVLRYLEDFENASLHAKRAMKIAKENNFAPLIAQVTFDIGDIAMLKGDYKEAIKYFLEAEKSQKNVNQIHNLPSIYKTISISYEKLGEFEKALEFHKKRFSMKDSLISIEKEKIINNLTTQYETEKKEQEIALLTTKEKAKSTQLNYSLGLGALLLLLLGLLFNRFREKQKTNQLLEEKNGKIELLLKEIHHRVKNNLQTISSLLFLQSAHIKDADVKEAVAEGQHRVESMALIHQKLYQRENLAAIEMKDYLTNLGNSLIDTFVNDPDRISLKVDMEEHELDVDTAVPLGLIANELITNSIKYAFPDERKGEIQLKVSNNSEGKLELLVADNGVGDANTKTGTAFGSQLINLLTKQLNGSLNQETDNGFWTKVVV